MHVFTNARDAITYQATEGGYVTTISSRVEGGTTIARSLWVWTPAMPELQTTTPPQEVA